ncbi:MAG: sugar transferase [bacterium]
MTTILNIRKFFLLAGDILILYSSLVISLFLGYWGKFDWPILEEHFLPFSIIYFLWLIIFYIFGLYDLNFIKGPFSFPTQVISALTVNLAIGMIFFYLFSSFIITPKTNLIINTLVFGFLFFTWRNIFYKLFSSYFLNKVAIIGKNPTSEDLAKEIVDNPYFGYKLKRLDTGQSLLDQIKKEKIDTLIVAESAESDFWLSQNLHQFLPLKISFLDLAEAYEIITQKIPISFVSKVWFLENIREKEKGFYEKFKRIMDLVLAVLILIVIIPLLPLIALAIKIEDNGPIFYYQERVGREKKHFKLIKFRSMITEAEENGPVWAEKDDPRVTKVGKLLRKTHLDEFPQMLNVIKGDISLIGPRPERPEFVEELETKIPYYHLRHLIKPGFSGWAQIKFRYGRSTMDAHKKFQYDLYYIKNRTPFLDIGILLKTFQLFFRKD